MGLTFLSFIRGVSAVVIVVAEPALVDAPAVLALELVVATAWLRTGTVVESGVLIGAVNAVWIAVANPLFGNALGAVPVLVLSASVLCLWVALAVIALVAVILVRVVQTVVIT